MDVDFKALTLEEAAAHKADALVVAVTDPSDGQTSPPTHGSSSPLAQWVRQVIDSGDLEAGAGKWLMSHSGGQCQARRVVLVRVGDGSPAAVRKGLLGALVALRQPGVKKVVVCTHLAQLQAGAWQAAVVAVADATYAYTTTLSKPKPRSLSSLVFVSDGPVGADAQAEVRVGQAVVEGVELAKEWANRPSNHATPTKLAQAAEKLARCDNVKVE
ncbi:MAG: M17 family peptidase N-terminal domain-containing protein, partial [Burkholderiaceae bacterium]|nr:M17 family peptidase N-terminal domain-containing protein [Burkholderiaceae bacterium]